MAGAMISMSPTVTLKGEVKFSMKKMIAGASLSTSHYTGPGELLLAPPMLGDITSIRLSGNDFWNVGHDAYLASTQGIVKDHKRQGLSKAIFSGEGLFVYKISGVGILWIASFGAIIRKDVSCALVAHTKKLSLTQYYFSLSKANDTLLITAILLHGIPSMFWSALPLVASSLVSLLPKVWFASLPAPAQYSCRLVMRYVIMLSRTLST